MLTVLGHKGQQAMQRSRQHLILSPPGEHVERGGASRIFLGDFWFIASQAIARLDKDHSSRRPKLDTGKRSQH